MFSSLHDTTMSDSLSYADRARKAISPSNLAVKALSIVAHHSNPFVTPAIDDWPQLDSQRNTGKSKSSSSTRVQSLQSSPRPHRPKRLPPDQHIDPAIKSTLPQSVDLAFIVSKSISSPPRLQPSSSFHPSAPAFYPQNKSSSSSPHAQGSKTPAHHEYTSQGPWSNLQSHHNPVPMNIHPQPMDSSSRYPYPLPASAPTTTAAMAGNQKVIFGSIGLEPPVPLSPTPEFMNAAVEIPTKTFSVGLDDLTEPVPARLRSRTRPGTDRVDAEDADDAKSNDPTISVTTIHPSKLKFGTMGSTPLVNGKKPLEGGHGASLDESSGEGAEPPNNRPSSSLLSSLLFQTPISQQSHPDCQPDTDSKGRKRGISFGYIDTPLPLDENISPTSKNKIKSKSKTKIKTNANSMKPSIEVEVRSGYSSANVDDGHSNSNDHLNSNSNTSREDRDRDKDKDVEFDADFKVKDFGYGFGSGGFGFVPESVGGTGGGVAQPGDVGVVIQGDGGQGSDGDNETGDNQLVPSGPQQNPHLRPVLAPVTIPINDIPPPPPQTPDSPIHAPVPVPAPTQQHPHGPPTGPPSHAQSPGHLHPRPSRRGSTFGNAIRGGGYGSHNHNHERGGFGPHERGGRRGGGRAGMNGYPRGYPNGRGYNRGGGGSGGPGPASSHSSPSSGGGGGGQRAPYNITPPPVLPPLPLQFSQLPHPHQQQQQYGIDPMYYPPRHISGGPGGGPGSFDPYQPYPHLQHQEHQSHLQQHPHLPPPHLQSYPHFQQLPPPLPPHLLASASASDASVSASARAGGGNSPTVSSVVPTAASSTGGDDLPSTTITTSTSASPNPNTFSSLSQTPPPPSSTSSSSHIPPPVPIPLTILPFPLDPTRYYLLGQLEYYLSPQNMVQDFFLRTQMDSKGYIPISLLASFNRIKQLTLDIRLVREVLLLSAFVEVRGRMVRMRGVNSFPTAGQEWLGAGGQGGGNEGQSQIQIQGGWESFVLPDAIESIVEDVESVESGGYGYHNGYGYGSGYGYSYGSGYGYGYGYGYPPGPGLGYYEDPQSQQPHQLHHQQQQQGGGGGGGGVGSGSVDEHGHISAHDHGEAASLMMNGHSSESTSYKLDDPTPHLTSRKDNEDNKLNGILKHNQAEHEGELQYEEEEEEEEEDVVFVMGTDVGTSWAPERERRA